MTCQREQQQHTMGTTIATTTAAINNIQTSAIKLRYTKEHLLARNTPELTTQPTEKVMNRLKWHKITRRTWAQKTNKKRERQRRRKRKVKTSNLPTILNFNSRSINNKLDDLKQIVDDNNADIIIITETWINANNETNHVNIIKHNNPGYEIISEKRVRDDVSRGGGVMIMVKKSYGNSVKQIEIKKKDNNQLLESIILRIEPKKNQEAIQHV